MTDERYALCFDSEQDCLGETALHLLRLGIDVLYANAADEALLLAADAVDSIHAVIVPPSVAVPDLERVLQRLEGAREGKSASVVVIGERPSDEVRTKLRAAGAEWAVWEPADDCALRFAVNAAITLPSEIVPRNEPRVPTSLMASFEVDGERGDAVVYTLSAKGAFLETPSPTAAGTSLEVEIWLPSIQVSTPAKVIYVNSPRDRRQASWPTGMAVVFDGLSEKHEARIRSYVTERAESTAI